MMPKVAAADIETYMDIGIISSFDITKVESLGIWPPGKQLCYYI